MARIGGTLRYGPDSSGGADPVETALLRATDELYRDDLVSAETWAALAKTLDTKQLLDMLIAVGGYRAVSMAINAALYSSTPTWRIFGFHRRCASCSLVAWLHHGG